MIEQVAVLMMKNPNNSQNEIPVSVKEIIFRLQTALLMLQQARHWLSVHPAHDQGFSSDLDLWLSRALIMQEELRVWMIQTPASQWLTDPLFVNFDTKSQSLNESIRTLCFEYEMI